MDKRALTKRDICTKSIKPAVKQTDWDEDPLEFAPATAWKNVNLEILMPVLIPPAPLAEQHRIIAKVDGLLAFWDRLEASLAAATRRLLDALLSEALVPMEGARGDVLTMRKVLLA